MAKKGKMALAIVAAAAAVVASAVTVAFMFHKTAVNNRLQLGEVSCTVHEMLDGGEFSEGVHEGNQKHSIRVENTGDVSAYIRVRLVSYWVDADGTAVGLPAPTPTLRLLNGWMQGADGAYYYPAAVEPGGFTGTLSSPLDLQTSVDANGNSVYQAVDLLAEAVQAEPTAAVAEAWGATVEQGRLQPPGDAE